MPLYRNGKQIDSKDLPTQKGQAAPAAEPGWFEPGSKSEAALRGFSNASTLGAGKYIGGAINALMNGEPVRTGIQAEVAANQRAAAENPISYGAGSLVGAAPLGAAAAGKSLAAQSGILGGQAGLTTLADTQDPKAALLSGAIGAGLPALGALASKAPAAGTAAMNKLTDLTGAAQSGTEKVAKQIGSLSRTGAALGLVSKGKLIGTDIRPGKIEEAIGSNGLQELQKPEWSALKDYILKQNSSDVKSAIGSAAKDTAIGSALGASLGGVVGAGGVGATLGGLAGATKGAKAYLENRAIQQELAPAAEAGVGKIMQELQNPSLGYKARYGAGAGGKFAVITNLLNQTSPEARAALNPDNPLNDESQDK